MAEVKVKSMQPAFAGAFTTPAIKLPAL